MQSVWSVLLPRAQCSGWPGLCCWLPTHDTCATRTNAFQKYHNTPLQSGYCLRCSAFNPSSRSRFSSPVTRAFSVVSSLRLLNKPTRGRGPSRPFVDNPAKLNLLGPALPVTFGAAAFAVAVAGLHDAHFGIAIRAVVAHAAAPRFQYRLL